jgi:NADH:ubiquinone reductase (H+-translocating)
MSQIKIKEEHQQQEEGEKHQIYSKSSSSQHIVILGGGFAGIGVLKKLQKKFQNDNGVDITLVNKNNFLLFTPMLPEVVSGLIETRHIVTPVRSFCRKAKFFEANVQSIDLDSYL